MRRFLRPILVLGLAGTLAELILLEHTENWWQKLPLALLALALVALLTQRFAPGPRATGVVRVVMASLLVAGGIGLYQHFMGNREFELEMNASRRGWELSWETLKGATPALAPGTMIYLGLLGLACAGQGGPTATDNSGPRSSDGRQHSRARR